MFGGLVRALGWVAVFVGLLVLLIGALVIEQGRRDDARPVGAAIVLGAAQWNGAPSPVLQARLDHALLLYRRGLFNRIILTGGVSAGETTSEAAVGRQYLLERGVPENVLLIEEQSHTTWENLRAAANLARANGVESVVLISDSFHMLRALKMAQDLGLTAYASPTRTSPIAENAVEEARFVMREIWAYLAYLFVRV